MDGLGRANVEDALRDGAEEADHERGDDVRVLLLREAHRDPILEKRHIGLELPPLGEKQGGAGVGRAASTRCSTTGLRDSLQMSPLSSACRRWSHTRACTGGGEASPRG